MYPFHTSSSFRKFASPSGLSHPGNSHLATDVVFSPNSLYLSLLSSLPLSLYLPFTSLPQILLYILSLSFFYSYSFLSCLCIRFVPNYFIGYITFLRLCFRDVTDTNVASFASEVLNINWEFWKWELSYHFII